MTVFDLRRSYWSSDVCSSDRLAAPAADEVPATGFVLYRQDLALAGASPVATAAADGTSAGPGVAAQRDVLLLIQPMDLTLFARAGIGEHIDSLRFLRGTAPPGYHGCEVVGLDGKVIGSVRSEEHTSELQSLMRISYAV